MFQEILPPVEELEHLWYFSHGMEIAQKMKEQSERLESQKQYQEEKQAELEKEIALAEEAAEQARKEIPDLTSAAQEPPEKVVRAKRTRAKKRPGETVVF